MKTLLKQFCLFALSVWSFNAFGQAKVQVIHNSADLSITTVDVYDNTNLLFDDLIFRSCSQFLNVPAGSTDISVTVSNSTDTTNAIFRKNFNFLNGEKYILMLSGIVSTSGYNPIIPFDIYSYPMARDSANTSGNIDVLFFHGVTDEGTIDVRDGGGGVYFDDADYGDYDGYISEPINDLVLTVTDAAGTSTINSYLLPASTFGFMDLALTVVASGFSDPTMNSNAPFPFGLWMALPVGGGLIDLPVVTGVKEENTALNHISMYPNPARNDLYLTVDLELPSNVSVQIYNMLGSKVIKKDFNRLQRGSNKLRIDISELDDGIYFCRIGSGSAIETRKLEIKK